MSVDTPAPRGRNGRRGHRRAPGAPDRHRVIPGDEVVELLPRWPGATPSSGYLFYDCQTDDSRLVLTVLAEAERFGAVCANGLEVTDLVEEGGRARGVRARDAPPGRSFVVRAANVVNATGVWADRLRPEELHDEAEVPRIRPEPRHAHHAAPRRRCRCIDGSDRPGRRRALDLRAAVARRRR